MAGLGSRSRTGLVRRAVAALAGGVLLLAASGCTDDSAEPSPQHPPTPAGTGTAATLQPKPAPLKVRVTRVAGRLSPKQRTSLEHNVGRVVGRYFDDAFLGGDYPRSDFHGAFATFSRSAAQRARGDRGLLTNADLGPTTDAVTPTARTAYLSVLAPNKVAAGVDARIRLEVVADRGDRPDRRVTLTGRLMLTRAERGGWEIFGYDVARSTAPAGKGDSR